MTSPAWRKSTYSDADHCVEVADVPGGVLVRDTKDRTRVPVRYTVEVWNSFVQGVKAGELDPRSV
jgi:hypothetical protein